jgi:type I restriction enzyme S subunit
VFSDKFTKVTSADPDRVAGLWLRDGDVLVQRSNTPELVGTTARYEGPDDWAIFPDLLIRLRANEQLVLSSYLCLALRSERAHRQMRSKAKGLAGSMPKIDQATIGSTLVPIPDLEIQRSFIERVDEVELIKARTIGAEETGRSRGRLLRQALLAAAFSGRLTGRTSDMEIVEEMAGV